MQALKHEKFVVAQDIQGFGEGLKLMESQHGLSYEQLKLDLLIDLRNFSYVQVGDPLIPSAC